MKLIVIYKSESDHGRAVEDFLHDIASRAAGQETRVVDPDSREGVNITQLYDIWQFPAVLVTQDNGAMQQLWLGTPLPLVGEVLAYARA